ncbi:MAG: TonB-dependent receptor, partial [Thermoanaerobaculia bacterium]
KGAIYIQDRVTLFGGGATLVGGLRYDAKSEIFDDYFSPRISLVVNPSKSLVLRAGWGTAFRFPGFSELYEDTWFLNVSNHTLPIPPIPLAVFKPNPNLKPEEVRTFDFGTEVQIGSAFSAKLDLFHSTVKRFMVVAFATPPPPALATLQIENHPDDATVLGGELELRATVQNVATGFVSYAYQEENQRGNLVDSTGKPFEFVYAPKHKINVGAYFGPFAGVRGTVELQYRSEYVAPQFWYLVQSNFTDPSIRPLPAYTLLNGRLSYELPFEIRGKKAVKLSVYGNNLLDERPQETLLGVPGQLPGREFLGRIEVSF